MLLLFWDNSCHQGYSWRRRKSQEDKVKPWRSEHSKRDREERVPALGAAYYMRNPNEEDAVPSFLYEEHIKNYVMCCSLAHYYIFFFGKN